MLQFCGTCSPYWIKDNNGTSDCFRGVVYNQGCPDGTEGKRNVLFRKKYNFNSVYKLKSDI